MPTSDDKQVGFEDWALAQRTRPNEVLEKIAARVDFSEAERRLEATDSELGRPGHRAAVLLRVRLLQHLCGLSDPPAETQLGDRLSFQKFAGLRERLLAMLNEQLAAAGYLVRRTMLVDATLVESSRTRPEKAAIVEGRAPDGEARYAKKHGKSYYGYKAHISADGDNQMVCRALITPANVDDSRVFAPLSEGNPRAVYADRMYDSARNARKNRRRRHIERIFGHWKRCQGYRIVRYLGLVKNQLELTLKAVTYNLRRLASLATA